MSKFEYTLPSGSTYVVNGPPGATQEQADRIFYEQVAAGSLVGYTTGQTLTSTATKITKFELSRLDRGIAGVDSSAIIAIAGNVLTLSEVSTTTGLSAVPKVPNLSAVPLDSPITQADIAKVTQDALGLPGSFSPSDIGPLTADQIQALLAQIANLVNQAYNEISYENGIGKYGLSCLSLERSGYIKPGTALRFLAVEPEDFISVMSSPGIWTGINGINSLDQLLQDPGLQTSIQTDLMTGAYRALQASGAIPTKNVPSTTLSQGTIYYQGVLQTATTLTNLVGSLGLTLNNQGVLTATKSISDVLNSSLSNNLNLTTLASGAVNTLVPSSLQNLLNLNSTNIATGLTNQLNGDISALITNGSIFGSGITTNWGSSAIGNLTNLGNLNFNGITDTITGGLKNLGSLTNLGGLTNISSLSDLTSKLDVFGKMSQFSTALSNPFSNLGSLSSLNLDSLNLSSLSNLNLSSLGLGSLGNLNLSSLGNLGNLGLGNLGLGNLGNLGLGSLGNLTNLAGLGNFSGLLGGLGLGSLASLGGVFGGGSSLVSSTQFAAGFTNTVNRSTLDSAVTRVLGNAKIPSPTFEFPSLQSIGASLDISAAKNILSNLTNTSTLISAAGQATGLNNTQISGLRTTATTVNRLIG